MGGEILRYIQTSYEEGKIKIGTEANKREIKLQRK